MVFFLKMTHVQFPDLTLTLARWMGKYYEPFESTFLLKKPECVLSLVRYSQP